MAAAVGDDAATAAARGRATLGGTAEAEPVLAPEPVIRLTSVVKTYGTGEAAVHALRGVSLDVVQRDYVAIMGASGSGKSTMMNIIGCLDVPSEGQFLIDGIDTSRLDEQQLAMVRNRKIGFVFQAFNLIPRMTALANVELPLSYAGLRAAERRRRAEAALRLVGLAERMNAQPKQLSGGQQQRVAVARALVTAPSLILADEPTGNLDTKASADLMGVFDRLNAVGRTIVLITHEADVAAHAKRAISVQDGHIVTDRRVTAADAYPPLLRRRRRSREPGPDLPVRAGRAGREQAALRADHAGHLDRRRVGDPAGRGRQRLFPVGAERHLLPGRERDHGAAHQRLGRPAAAPTSAAGSTAFAEPQNLTAPDAQALAQAQGVTSASPVVSTSETLSNGGTSDSAEPDRHVPELFPGRERHAERGFVLHHPRGEHGAARGGPGQRGGHRPVRHREPGGPERAGRGYPVHGGRRARDQGL